MTRPRDRVDRDGRTVIRIAVDNARRALMARIAAGAAPREVLVTFETLAAIMIGGATFEVSPARATLAARLGTTERTVTRHIRRLEGDAEQGDEAVIEVDRDDPRYSRRRGWHRARTNVYRLVAKTRPNPRKTRSPAGDTRVTRSSYTDNRGTDSTPPLRPEPVDNGPPPWRPPDLAERDRVTAMLTDLRQRKGWT